MLNKSSNMSDAVNVNALLGELKKSFIADIPSRLSDMEAMILSADNEDTFSDNFETLYRQTHSLKGTAGSYGLHIITSICHKFEDALSSTQGKHKPFMQHGMDNWLKYVDLLQTTIESIESGKTDFSDVERRLVQLETLQTGGGEYKHHALIVAASHLYEQICNTAFGDSPIKFSFSRDGHEALGRLLNEPFDIVITDMEAPLLNGMALIGALRLSTNRNRKIRAILLTSTKMEKINRTTDPDYVVLKDSNFANNLTSTIESLIHQHHA